MNDLADEPMLSVLEQGAIDRQHPIRISRRPKYHGSDQRLVHPQTQERVIELSKRSKRPELVAGSEDAVWIGWLGRIGARDRQIGDSLLPIEVDSNRRVLPAAWLDLLCDRPERDARTAGRPIGTSSKFR